MALVKLNDFYPDYREGHTDSKSEIKHFDVYTQREQKVGAVDDILVDDREGRFRYLIVDTGGLFFGKKVLLPVGLASINYTENRVYVNGLNKEQIERLPNVDDLKHVDRDHEEQVRHIYHPTASAASTTQTSVGATSGALENRVEDHNHYNYDQNPGLYHLNDRDHESLKLYEERLIATKHKQKTGEVTIGKRVETETAKVSVPVEKERVIIERTTPTEQAAVSSGTAFSDGEVARVEVYEETPDIRKEAFVREEVRVKKVVEQDTVSAEETLRREELNVDTQGRPIVDK